MIDTRWTSDSPVDIQWTRDSSPVRCYQSGITLNGTAITIDAGRPNSALTSVTLRSYAPTKSHQAEKPSTTF